MFPKVAIMVYLCWKNSRAQLGTYYCWFELEALFETLTTILKYQISHYGVFDLFETTIFEAPYDMYTRFPLSKKFICASAHNNWKKNIAQFYKLRKYLNNDGSYNREDTILLRNIVREMYCDAFYECGVFDQATFEKWGGVVWYDI